MRKPNAFKPGGIDMLEDRLVLATVPLTPLIGPAQVSGAPFRVSTSAVNRVLNDMAGSFNAFLGDYAGAIRQVRRDQFGTPNTADVNRFFNSFLPNRANVLTNQLINEAGRLPFGRVNLSTALSNRVATMLSRLEGVTTIDQALHPGATVRAAFRGVKSDVLAYVNVSRAAGSFTF